MKRFLPFVLAIVGTTLALGFAFLVLGTDLVPIRLGSELVREEAVE